MNLYEAELLTGSKRKFKKSIQELQIWGRGHLKGESHRLVWEPETFVTNTGKETETLREKNRTFPFLKGELLFSLAINTVLIALKLYLKIDIKDSAPNL